MSLQTVILLDLPNYLHLFYPRSKQGFRTNCYSMGGVNQRWILKTKQRLKMCFSRYNQCPSPHAITLKHLISLPSTQLLLCVVNILIKQKVIIPMGTNCVPILVDFYLYSYEANFIPGIPKKHEKKLVRSLYFTSAIQVMSFHYISLVILLIAPIPLTLR